ncbi:hypothetical protein C2E25_16005 [Geothermobacter hydrogeniphilus]|uniref:OmpA-like domain-containing protein n=1 Tax=Geothermobacter hydrogeniphilus TaxID=1969733 RepID=A0A2K2H602_9BACT|nr:OmpA family protein [Geothermobacter hydrogeniphilus]PNU18754.1 hypothetical protein C2E25_16005 [Geothermobacter hydrogeniphilus]
MKKVLSAIFSSVFLLLISAQISVAVPTQYGDTGLLSQPTAETLNAGNICLGVWNNYSSGKTEDADIMPVSITLGLGSFLEMYGTYPNLLFNNDETVSGRGTANLGAKIRFLGKRSSRFKMALEGEGRRSISDDPNFDGLTDYATRVIASLKLDRVGFHANGGYIFTDDPANVTYDNQTTAGAGIEFYPVGRLRMIAEGEWRSNKISGRDDYAEVSVGFQYFISPHFTLNLGASVGLTDETPDWRLLAGFSGCQGIGTYQRPIPKLVEPALPEEKEPEKPKKVVKIKTLTPLVPVSAPVVKPLAVTPVSKLEVPVPPKKEVVVLEPSEQLVIPDTEELQALNVSPVAGAAPPIPSKPIINKPVKTLVYRKFQMDEFTFDFDQFSLTESGRKALAVIADELRQDDKWFVIRFDGHTDSIGSERYNEKLSLKRAISTATGMVVNNGFDPSRIFVKGFGESEPIAGNDTPEGRGKNRRVEILVLVKKAE